MPYKVFPDKITPATGLAPSLFVRRPEEVAVKLCKIVKFVPLVFTANTVPLPELPLSRAVPYSVSPDKITPAYGLLPSAPPVKLCRFEKVCAITRPRIKPRPAINASKRNRFLMQVFSS